MLAKQQQSINKDQPQQDFDELFKDAVRLVIKRESVSINLIQREFEIGFNRAGKIVDQMEQAGFVSPQNNSRARELYITQQEFEKHFGEDL